MHSAGYGVIILESLKIVINFKNLGAKVSNSYQLSLNWLLKIKLEVNNY